MVWSLILTTTQIKYPNRVAHLGTQSFQVTQKSEKMFIIINQTVITQVSEKRVLGVIIDEKLTFKSHINYISLQARKYFSFLEAFPFLAPATLATIYKPFIRSHIKYCYSAWSHKLYYNNNLKTLGSV